MKPMKEKGLGVLSLIGFVAIALFCKEVATNQSCHFQSNVDERRTAAATTLSLPQPQLSPRNMTGTWIGNQWIPPPSWKLYSVEELQDFYKHKSVYFVGDSMARRLGQTLFEIMNTSSPNADYDKLEDEDMLEINKGDQAKVKESCTLLENVRDSSVCRRWPDFIQRNITESTNSNSTTIATTGLYLMNQEVKCAYMQRTFIEKELKILRDPVPAKRTKGATYGIKYLIVAMGAWEIRFPKVCDRFPAAPVFPDGLEKLMDSYYEFQRITGITVVFRTSGYVDQWGANGKGARSVNRMNKIVMDRLDEYQRQDPGMKLTYVNWGGAVESRSYGSNRIKGDHIAHYGLEARSALIHMITNRIQEMEERNPLPPAAEVAASVPLTKLTNNNVSTETI